MSLLDDARRLAEMQPGWDPGTEGWACSGCRAVSGPFADEEREADVAYAAFAHDPDCPWLSMPKIVAVIEAAARVAAAPPRGRHVCSEECACQFKAIAALRAVLEGDKA
jgi:hypothetical protein